MAKKPEPAEVTLTSDECPHDTLTARKLTISKGEFTKVPPEEAANIVDRPKYKQQGPDKPYFEEILTVSCPKCDQVFHTYILS